ncbi:hypothetical protein BX616_009470 [Lobosporangium transversale]|nr:hypothetical protein BX616_009470 [Lobosporangium transversale]
MSNNITDRVSHGLYSGIGDIKKATGEAIGNPDLASSGASQKAQADAAQADGYSKTHAEGAGHKVQGRVQQTVGSITGDHDPQTRGHANELQGDLERKV